MLSTLCPTVIFGEALVDVFAGDIIPGGAPFNVARHMAAFGAAPKLITRIGDDAHGALILQECARFGLGTDGVQIDAHHPTGAVTVTMTAQGHHFDIPQGQAFDHIDAGQALATLRATPDTRTLYCGTLIQRSAVSSVALATLEGEAGTDKYLDLNLCSAAGPMPDLASMIGQAGSLKVNDEELATLVALYLPEYAGFEPVAELPAAALAALMARFGVGRLMLTLGAHGAAVYAADGACTARVPGCAGTVVVDTVGAGDAFSSIMLTGHALAWPLKLTLARANAFAAAICGVRGAVPASLAFYAPWHREWGM